MKSLRTAWSNAGDPSPSVFLPPSYHLFRPPQAKDPHKFVLPPWGALLQRKARWSLHGNQQITCSIGPPSQQLEQNASPCSAFCSSSHFAAVWAPKNALRFCSLGVPPSDNEHHMSGIPECKPMGICRAFAREPHTSYLLVTQIVTIVSVRPKNCRQAHHRLLALGRNLEDFSPSQGVECPLGIVRTGLGPC